MTLKERLCSTPEGAAIWDAAYLALSLSEKVCEVLDRRGIELTGENDLDDIEDRTLGDISKFLSSHGLKMEVTIKEMT